MKCNQCNAAIINGVFCHEIGCPNMGKRYNDESEEWVQVHVCSICGYEYEDGEICCEIY